MDSSSVARKSFIQPWMVLLILPLLGFGTMVLVLVSDSGDPVAKTKSTQIGNLPSPLPQTLPPRTPLPTSTSVMDQPVPKIVLTDLAGNRFTLADFKGRPLIVNFWATWCEPCEEEMPQLQAYSDAQDENGPLVIAVTDPANGQDIETIRAFLEERGLTLRVGLDEEAALHYALNVPGLPTTFFINADGIIQGRRIGRVDFAALVDEVALLDGTGSSP